MTREIWKFPIDLETMGAQHAIPEGAALLDLQMQDGVPVMWWSVDPKAPTKLYTFVVAPTGTPGYVPSLHYVGTFQDGAFVGHVFSHEEVPQP